MKSYKTIGTSIALIVGLSAPAFAGPVGISRSNAPTAQNEALMAQLGAASNQAARAGRYNKNNGEFALKRAEINELIDRMKNGQPVAPEEIDKALQPARVP